MASTGSTSSVQTVQDPPAPPRPGPEHERLNVFVGKWNTEGEMKASESGPAVKILGVDTYEWLEGGFFLVHRVDVRMGDEQVNAIEIIGYDASRRAYVTRAFDSQGNSSAYTVTVRDDVWTFTGDTERSTVVVGDAGNSMVATWERSSGGSRWVPWMEVRLTKADVRAAGRS